MHLFKKINIINLAFLTMVLSIALHSQPVKLNVDKKYPVLLNNDALWIGTPTGLLRYESNNDVYKKYNFPFENISRNIKQIYTYQDWLWCVLDEGLAALHLKLNEWLFFDSTKGLPSNNITGIDFFEDYVWISSPNGAARFDLMIEQWEKYDEKKGLPNIHIKDIAAARNKLWFLSDSEFSEYDTKYEKWRYYKFEDESFPVFRRIIKFGDEIWFLSNSGIERFNPATQFRESFSGVYLKKDELIEIFIEGNILWVISKSGIFYFDKNSNIWKEFEGNNYLDKKIIENGYISPNQIWIFTGSGILLWNRTNKAWETLDYSSGLSGSKYSGSYTDGNLSLLFNDRSIEYRKFSGDPWHIYNFEKPDKEITENIFKNFLDNPDGGYLPVGNYRWSWQGSSLMYLYNFNKYLYDNSQDSPANTKSNYRLDIKNRIDLGHYGSLSGFYNNIDLNETEYGLKYRGNDSSLVREIDLGDFRRDPGEIAFNEGANLYGVNLRMHYGEKTERFKRSLFTVRGNTGELRTKKTFENYKGVYSSFNYTISSRDFIKNRFYEIDGLNIYNTPGEINIFVDDLNPENNTTNTFMRRIIAGITGDFDRLKPVEDYSYNETFRIINFIRSMNSKGIIIITYKINNQYYESILQNGDISTVKNSFYYLNGQKIIPFTLKLSVKDSLQTLISLNKLGIDNNNDGFIDPSFMDYEKGILYFPVNISLLNGLILKAEYKTEYSMIQLKHKNLLRGSETLILDGITASAGNDYIIDYTNGTLIFVREGALNNDTRIEIEYEYYEENNGNFSSIGVNYSPSDNFYLQTGWQKTDKGGTNLFDINSEIRHTIGEYDIRILPGAAYSVDSRQITGKSIDGFISSNRLRMRTLYQDYSENYINTYTPGFSLGNLKSKALLQAAYDFPENIRLTGEWKKLSGFAVKNNNTEETAGVSFLIHNNQLPNIQISVQDFKSNILDSAYKKIFLQCLGDYQVPKNILKNIFLQNIKLEGFLRLGKETEDNINSPSLRLGTNLKYKLNEGFVRRDFSQWYIRINTRISDQFQGGLFYRNNKLNDDNEAFSPISSSQRVLFDLSHEEWQLLHTNLRVENNLNRYYLVTPQYENTNLRQFSQINFRLNPGKLWEILNPLYFELNYNNTLYNNGLNDRSFTKYLWQPFSENIPKLDEMMVYRNYYIKNEYRPYSEMLLYSLFEWNTQKISLNSNTMNRLNFRWNEKLDFKLGLETRMILQYKYYRQDLSFNRYSNEYEPSFWLEHRFSHDFLNNVNIIYKNTEIDNNNIHESGYNWQIIYNMVWQKNRFLGMKYIEVNQAFSGSFQNTTVNGELRSVTFSSNSSIDLYPLYSLIIRLRLDISRFMDKIFENNNFTFITFNLKTTLQI